MLTVRQRLISVVALVAVLGSAVLWLLLGRAPLKSFSNGANVPPQSVRAASLERPRPAIHVGREFRLEELMRFDSESAPWLSAFLEEYPSDGARPGGGVRQPEQLASAGADQKRSGAR